jgi:hypothetical protein
MSKVTPLNLRTPECVIGDGVSIQRSSYDPDPMAILLPRSSCLRDLEYPMLGLSPCELSSPRDLSISATYPPQMDGSWSSRHFATSRVLALRRPLTPSSQSFYSRNSYIRCATYLLVDSCGPHRSRSRRDIAYHDFATPFAILQSFNPQNPNMRIHEQIR